MSNYFGKHRAQFILDHHSRLCPNYGIGWVDPRALYCSTSCLSYVGRHMAAHTDNVFN